MSDAQKTIDPQKMMYLVETNKIIKMKTKLSLAKIPFLLIQISLKSKLRLLRKINAIKEIIKEKVV